MTSKKHEPLPPRPQPLPTRSRAAVLSIQHVDSLLTQLASRDFSIDDTVGDVSLELINELSFLTEYVSVVTRSAVAFARDLGISWSDIAGQLGISRQAAQQRFRQDTAA